MLHIYSSELLPEPLSLSGFLRLPPLFILRDRVCQKIGDRLIRAHLPVCRDGINPVPDRRRERKDVLRCFSFHLSGYTAIDAPGRLIPFPGYDEIHGERERLRPQCAKSG
jgi:hypothetical protein